MITLSTPRQYLETFVLSFFSYIDQWKKTKINNVINRDAQSDEYLSAVALNCVLSEVQDRMRKKLINTKSQNVKIEFSEAQGVVLYKTLFLLQLANAHQVAVVTNWMAQFNGQIINNKIYEENKIAKIQSASSCYDHFDD